MKIVNLKTFRALPENTVFSKYEPCVFWEIQIKGETWEKDFLTQSIHDSIKCTGSDDFMTKLDHAQATGESLEMDFDIQGRDGLFVDEQLFAVWEQADVQALIERLKRCLPNVEAQRTAKEKP